MGYFTPGQPEEAKVDRAAQPVRFVWDESKHARDHGKFASKPGSSGDSDDSDGGGSIPAGWRGLGRSKDALNFDRMAKDVQSEFDENEMYDSDHPGGQAVGFIKQAENDMADGYPDDAAQALESAADRLEDMEFDEHAQALRAVAATLNPKGGSGGDGASSSKPEGAKHARALAQDEKERGNVYKGETSRWDQIASGLESGKMTAKEASSHAEWIQGSEMHMGPGEDSRTESHRAVLGELAKIMRS